MSLGWLLLNTAYLVYTASAIFKDMLMLRAALLTATFLYLAYGLADPNWSVFFWNVPVAILHMYAIWQLLRARRGIDLDEEAEAIRTLIFPDLDRSLFNTMWHLGAEHTVHDEVLIVKGEAVDQLQLILDGEVDVEVNNDLIVRLSQYRLIGEMSWLNNARASATVKARGSVTLRSWRKTDLVECGRKHHAVELAVLKAMGQEVARKLN